MGRVVVVGGGIVGTMHAWTALRRGHSVIQLEREPDAPIPPIVAGDFNAEPDSTEIRFMTGLATLDGKSVYFQDAWRVAGGGGPGFTWDNRNEFAVADREPDRRIDYIFVGWTPHCGVGVSAARLVCDRALTGVHASDHLGLVAEVYVPLDR